MNITYLHLGSNLGDRHQNLYYAIELIKLSLGSISGLSAVYETEAWGNTDQNDFLNQVVVIKTHFSPHDLLEEIQLIEKFLGRHREIKWAPRIIDIDILFYNDDVFESSNLIVPHPFLHERNFVLEPLKEIAGDQIHPVFKKTVNELYEMSKDKAFVKLLVK